MSDALAPVDRRAFVRAVDIVRMVVEGQHGDEIPVLLQTVPDDELRPLIMALVGFTGNMWLAFDRKGDWLSTMLREAAAAARSGEF